MELQRVLQFLEALEEFLKCIRDLTWQLGDSIHLWDDPKGQSNVDAGSHSMSLTSEGLLLNGNLILFSEFPGLVERHLARVKNTRELEMRGLRLQARDFSEKELRAFIRDVCNWGGYAGIAERVFKQNSIADIQRHFRVAAGHLYVEPPRTPSVRSALEEINLIKELGQPSFASKHLRFLFPVGCPVLDSHISQSLGYSFDADGYERFCYDCLRLATELRERGVSNPMRRPKEVPLSWFAADVEMAIFAYLREY